MMDAAAKEARNNYETLLRAHAQLQSQLLAERELWAQQEDTLRKENAELRSQILYTAAKLASSGPQISSNVRSNSVDSNVVDGRAAAGELPSPAPQPTSPQPSSSFAAPSTQSIQRGISAAFNAASAAAAEQEAPSWASEIEAAMSAVDNLDILTQDVDYAAVARNKQQQAPTASTPDIGVSTTSIAAEEEVEIPAGASPTGPPPNLAIGSDDIFWVNQLHTAMVDAGFYPGDDEIDAYFFGDSTLSALMTFQACEGLSETGAVDEDTWKKLLGPELTLKPSRDLTADQSANIPGITDKLNKKENESKPFAELFTASSEQTVVVGSDGAIESETSHTTVSETDIYLDGHVVKDSVETTVTHTETKKPVEALMKWPSLIDGDGGKYVHALHVLLDDAGFSPGEDDIRWWQFGDSTVAAVKTFQACNGIPESGAACVRTWQALMPEGSVPNDILSVQSGHSDDDDLAEPGEGRVWLLGEQRWEVIKPFKN
jgi:peptidoglycan hydrolase-like protein with peptidoglycan-binding domain